MSATVRTTLFAGVAAALLIAAVATAPHIGSGPRFEDEGELFFPEFKSPEQALSLEAASHMLAVGIEQKPIANGCLHLVSTAGESDMLVEVITRKLQTRPVHIHDAHRFERL